MKKEVLLMSACLMGVNCRYDGGGKTLPQLPQLMERYHIIPVCGEVMGGMTTPRIPSERVGDKVMDRAGRDVTEHFRRGAEEVLRLARLYGAEKALLKERSPSCGSGEIYDGSFSGTKTAGWGVTAELLRGSGIAVYGESRAEELLG
ncbi:MAG: DUF523 domain-containing protein [Oscillospiraceae bacterium]|nr:DUF523 domain-containing protein [Oscillospiraceae bacterium]